MDTNESSYYTTVRESLLFFLFFTAAYSFSVVFLILLRFFKRRARGLDNSFDDEDDHQSGFLPFLLCSFVVSNAVLWLFLVFMTAVVATKKLNLHWALYWLTPKFVIAFYIPVMWMSTLSLFMVVPFAYFYYEAQGFGWRKGVVARLLETSVVFALFAIMLRGAFRILQSMWTGSSPFTSMSGSTVSLLAHNIPGFLVVLCYTQDGCYTLLMSAYGLRVPIESRAGLQEKLDAHRIESSSLKHLLRDSEKQRRRKLSAVEELRIVKEISRLEAEIKPMKKQLSEIVRHPYLQNLVCFFFLFLTTVMPLFVWLRAVCTLVLMLTPSAVYAALAWLSTVVPGARFARGVLVLCLGSGPPVGISGGDLIGSDGLGDIEVVHPGILLTIELALVLYLLLGAAVGLYTGHLSKMLWMPGASIHVLLVNSAVLLFLCSSLPIVVWTLGIVSFNLPDFYPEADVFSGTPQFIYLSIFLIVCGLKASGQFQRHAVPLRSYFRRVRKSVDYLRSGKPVSFESPSSDVGSPKEKSTSDSPKSNGNGTLRTENNATNDSKPKERETHSHLKRS
eukprot:12695_1